LVAGSRYLGRVFLLQSSRISLLLPTVWLLPALFWPSWRSGPLLACRRWLLEWLAHGARAPPFLVNELLLVWERSVVLVMLFPVMPMPPKAFTGITAAIARLPPRIRGRS
jgi:hypothetical protein